LSAAAGVATWRAGVTDFGMGTACGLGLKRGIIESKASFAITTPMSNKTIDLTIYFISNSIFYALLAGAVVVERIYPEMVAEQKD